MKNVDRFSCGDRVRANVFTSEKSKPIEGIVTKVYAHGAYEITDSKGGAVFVSPKESIKKR